MREDVLLFYFHQTFNDVESSWSLTLQSTSFIAKANSYIISVSSYII